MEPEAAKIAYEQASERLQRQVNRLAEIRSTTSFLLAATALVASFFGDKALDASNIEPLEGIALGALVGGVLCGIIPLWPISDREPASLRRSQHQGSQPRIFLS